jgi:hypothetical protein
VEGSAAGAWAREVVAVGAEGSAAGAWAREVVAVGAGSAAKEGAWVLAASGAAGMIDVEGAGA